MADIKEKCAPVVKLVQQGADKADVNMFKEKAIATKDKAVKAKEQVSDKIHELDIQLEKALAEYNAEYTTLNDEGMNLYMQRTRSVDVIDNIEELLNTIANKPLSFDSDFEEINKSKLVFKDAEAFAKEKLDNARKAAGSAGAGIAAGAAVMNMAPSAAMWIATTFGTASTGTAISTLSGAAAQNAALAWLAGGTLINGGGGVAGGTAFLALAGPVGISIAGASLLVSILLFSKNKIKTNKSKSNEIEAVKNNTATVKKNTESIRLIFAETVTLREQLSKMFTDSMYLSGQDYNTLSDEDKMRLGALVNNTKALSAVFAKTVE